ncbi:MAG TPA: CDP-alcohol phosphatidyltransferase family protein [Acidimicrobiia bacterium]|nr:CDP-alcohol phosphatidyltransferase family protein [Acidimicrobiia bacterium]
MAETRSGGSRILTIPNVISLARLLCVPVFLWMLWRDPPLQIMAAVLLAVLGASDWVDGYIARRFDQGSELGKILDPTADRVLLLAGAIALLHEGLSTAVDVMLWIIIAREIVIATATIALGLAGARRIDVVWAGKAGTLALMFALPAFLLAEAAPSISTLANVVGWGFAIAGVVLGYYAAVRYVPAARAALQEGRAARIAAEVRG